MMSSNTDPQSYPQARQFLLREVNVPGVQPYIVQNVGHSLDAYQAVLAPVLEVDGGRGRPLSTAQRLAHAPGSITCVDRSLGNDRLVLDWGRGRARRARQHW